MNNFAFFGSSERAVWCLEALKAHGILPLVIFTHPDKKVGRGLTLTPSATKVWGEQNQIPVHTPENLKDQEFKDLYTSYKPALGLVLAYGKIMPEDVLNIPKHGTLNIHGSLLPKLRGASPVESIILSGEKPGVTLMLMDKEMDHGPILGAKELSYSEIPHVSTLAKDIVVAGAQLFLQLAPQWIEGKIQPTEQDHAHATYTKKLSKEDGLITWKEEPNLLWRKFQALTPWPGLFWFIDHNGKQTRVIIKKMHWAGKVHIDEVLVEGKKPMSWKQFRMQYTDVQLPEWTR